MSIRILKKNIFSQNLKELRNHKEITLQKLSEILNQKYGTVEKYEFLNVFPPIATMIKMTKYFGFSIDFFLMGNENTYINNIELLKLSEKIDKINSSERFKIESTIETLLKSSDNNLKSDFDTVDIQLSNNIHSNIKILREKKQHSQRELSKVLIKSSSVINQYETGKNTPSPENLIKLSDFFNISIHYLITGEKLFFNFIDKAFENTVQKADKQLFLEDQKFLIKLMNKIIE